MIEKGARVYGYRFDGYWQDVGTIQSYWEANLALLADAPELDLYDREWVIHTRSEERAPAKIGSTAQVHRSLISHGCVINGSVVNSVLSPGVVVDVGAVVRDSIVLFDTIIRPGAVVDRAILDKEVAVGPGAIIGEGTDFDEVNRREPGRLNTGITVVGKRAVIPRGVRIGRNVLIGEGVRATDFPSRVVRSGSTIERPRERAVRSTVRAATGDTSSSREPGAGSVSEPPHQTAGVSGAAGNGGAEILRAAGEVHD
jgi:glucose-1-phosphate adenylyltransferase